MPDFFVFCTGLIIIFSVSILILGKEGRKSLPPRRSSSSFSKMLCVLVCLLLPAQHTQKYEAELGNPEL
jgi:hypothetical protein